MPVDAAVVTGGGVAGVVAPAATVVVGPAAADADAPPSDWSMSEAMADSSAGVDRIPWKSSETTSVRFRSPMMCWNAGVTARLRASTIAAFRWSDVN